MTSLKNGPMHTSPDLANIVISSGNIIPIAVQSQVTVIHDQDNGTDEAEYVKLFKTADSSERLPNLKLSLNNNLPVSSYSHLPTSGVSYLLLRSRC